MKKPAFNTIAIILIVVGFRSMAISSPYPWESIYIEGDQVPVAIDFNKPETISGFQEALAVYLDMGRKLTEKEITRLKSKMKIIDQKGKKCRLFSYGSADNITISTEDLESGEKTTWRADFAVILKYLAPWGKSTYSLYWENQPPLQIGNPLSTPFCQTLIVGKKSEDKGKIKREAKNLSDVRLMCEAQELLHYLGYSPGAVDGVAGTKTHEAIKAFQKDKGLPQKPLLDKSILSTLRTNYEEQSHLPKGKISHFKQRPSNGKVFKISNAKEIAPLEIVTPNKENDFLIKLEDSKTKSTIKIFYVRGGSKVKSKVPLGSFGLKYAAGEQWLCNNCLFGIKTIYSKAEKTLVFSRTGNQVTGYTVELILQPGGNLRTSKIPPNEW